MPALRGQVWLAELENEGSKPWIIVSHNARNKNFGSVLAVRVTTSNHRAHLDTVMELPEGECVHGWVVCDSLTEIWNEDFKSAEPLGAVSRTVLKALQPHLLAALGY